MGGGYYGEREVISTGNSTTAYSAVAEQVMQQKSLHSDCDPKKKQVLLCAAKTPMVIAIDVTGSMGNWSKIIYDKLPMFYGQLIMKNYCADPSLSFAAIGDTNTDEAPLQVTEFSQGAAIDSVLAKLWLEGAGGGQNYESYELAAYFYSSRCKFTEAKKGYMFITGDEGFYPAIVPEDLKKILGEDAQQAISTDSVFKNLLSKFHVFFLHKPYYDEDIDKNLVKKWNKLIGEANVLSFHEAKAVVDIMLGAISLVSGSRTLDTYILDMKERGQSEDRIVEVKAALELLAKNTSQTQTKDNTPKSKIPEQFLCPITTEMMNEPVTLEGDGITYEKSAIEEWLESRDVSPVTGQLLDSKTLTPNKKLAAALAKFKQH